MIRKSPAKGLTLIELLVTLTIASIVFTMGVPAAQGLIERQQTRMDIEQIRMLLFTTRSHAIISASNSVLCPLNSSGECFTDWNQPLTAFDDPNGNRMLDPNETILGTIEAAEPEIWRSYPRKAFVINAKGYAGYSNGTLGYCRTLSSEAKTGASFIISRMGRIRPGPDKNENGIYETASGKEIPCE